MVTNHQHLLPEHIIGVMSVIKMQHTVSYIICMHDPWY